MGDFLSVAEFSTSINRPVRFAYRAIKRGTINATLINNVLYINRNEIDEYNSTLEYINNSLSVAEVSKLLNKSIRTIQYEIQKGNINAKLINGKLHIDRSGIENYKDKFIKKQQ